MSWSRDDKESQVVAVLVGTPHGDRLGGVLVGAYYRLGFCLWSLLRRIEVRDEVGDVAIGAARVPGATRIVGNCVAVLVSPMVEYKRRVSGHAHGAKPHRPFVGDTHGRCARGTRGDGLGSVSATRGARSVVGGTPTAMRRIVHRPARGSGGSTAQRYVAVGEGRGRHAGLVAHGGYLVGCPEPLGDLEMDLHPATRVGRRVYGA